MSFLETSRKFNPETPATVAGTLEAFVTRSGMTLEYIAGDRPEENVRRFQLYNEDGESCTIQEHESYVRELASQLKEMLGADFFVHSGEAPTVYIQVERVEKE